MGVLLLPTKNFRRLPVRKSCGNCLLRLIKRDEDDNRSHWFCERDEDTCYTLDPHSFWFISAKEWVCDRWSPDDAPEEEIRKVR